MLTSPSCYPYENLDLKKIENKPHFKQKFLKLKDRVNQTALQYKSTIIAQRWNSYFSDKTTEQTTKKLFQAYLEQKINRYLLQGTADFIS